MGIHVVPDKVRAMWNEQEIRVLVLLSLLLQILLIFLAPLRKRCASKLLAFALWSFYLGADYMAIMALGNILSGQIANDSSQPTSDGELIAFWAPFMLLHLGGPDTITSFSQEDNDLWLRHLLGLIVQVSVAFLVFLSSSFSSRLLMAGSVLVFLSGLIKSAERTWALRLASKEKVEGTIGSLRMPAENMFNKPEIVAVTSQSSLPDSEPLPEPLLISTAYYFFVNFTRPILLEGTYLPHDLDVIDRCSSFFIQICNTIQAFRMVEVELSFFHDIRHTKASFLHSLNGVAWRCLTLLLVVAALLLFQLSEKQASKKSNLVITYTLVLAGVVLEIVSVLFLICSDWTISSLQERGFRRIVGAISEVTHCIFRKPKPRWSNTMAQYNLISIFLRTNNPSFMRRVMGLLKLEEAWDKVWYVNHVRVPNKLKYMIVDTLRLYDMSSIGFLIDEIKLRSQVEFRKAQFPEQLNVQDSIDILFWSIATQICYNITSVKEKNDEELMMHRMIGHQLSNYMMDTFAPEMEYQIDSFYKNVKSFFDRKEQLGSEADVCNKLIYHFQKEETSFEYVLQMGLKRAKYMNELEVGLRWRLICFLWVDVLIVQAHKLDEEKIWESEWLNNGGQLILNVWVLTGHFKDLQSGIAV